MKCIVQFRLKPGMTPEQYETWFRESNVPAVRTMKTITSYRVWRVASVMEGEPAWLYLEEMEITGQSEFEAELEASAAMAAMIEGWYERVADQVVVFGEEVAQDA